MKHFQETDCCRFPGLRPLGAILTVFALLAPVGAAGQGADAPSWDEPTLSQADALEDFDALVSALREIHQGLYQYRPRGEVDAEIDRLRGGIDGPTTMRDFYGTVRRVYALADEAHGGVSMPDAVGYAYDIRPEFLPLTVTVAADAVLPRSIHEQGDRAERITARDRIVSIDGEPIERIVADMLPLVATDGHIETGAMEHLGVDFPDLYRLIRPPKARYDVGVQAHGSDTVRSVTLDAVPLYAVDEGEAAWRVEAVDPPDFVSEALGCGLSYLAATSFYGDINFRASFQDAFTEIARADPDVLILDLTENDGGYKGVETLLALYLIAEPFDRYRWVSAPSDVIRAARSSAKLAQQGWQFDGARAVRGNYTFDTRYFEDFDYPMPNPMLVYDGPVVAVISGRTFSAGAEIASILRMRDRARFVGTETGGAYAGNVSGFYETVELPHSDITVDVPVIQYRFDVDPDPPGRGVMPDVPAPQTWADHVEGRNAALEAAIAEARRIAGVPETCETALPDGE